MGASYRTRWLTLALLGASLAAPIQAQWYWRHPQPRGYSLLSLSFPTATTGWAVGGAPLKTTDGGRTWLIQDRDALVGALAVSFVDENNGLAVGVSSLTGFIRRTTDGGINWETTWSEFGAWGRDVTFVAGSPGVAVVAGVDLTTVSPHILLSMDGGATWERRPLPDGLGEGDARNVAFADASIGIATVPSAPAGNFLRTTDGGVTWALHEVETDAALLDVTFVDAGIGTLVGTDGAIFRTTDGGETWEPQDSGTSLALQNVSFSDADHGIALAGAGLDGGVILTTADGGLTWTVRSSPATFLEAVAFSDTSTATAVGTGGDIYRTADGGQTWVQMGTRLAKSGLWDLAFVDRDTATAVGGRPSPVSDPGATIVRTEDGGNTWRAQESGTDMPLYGVSVIDEEFGIAVGGILDLLDPEGVILRTTDAGESWIDVTPTDLPDMAFRSLSCVETVDGIACTAVGICESIIRTWDGGDSWEVQQEPTCPSLLFKGVSFTDPDTGTAVGGGKILRTTDGGETWTLQSSPIGGLEDVFFVDGEVGFAVGRSQFASGPGAIIATTDGGETWVVQRNDLPATAVSVAFTDAAHGAVVTSGGEIYRTMDGGASWVLDQDLPGMPAGIAFGDAETAMVVGASVAAGDAAIFKTVGGPTFPLSLSPSSTAVCVPESGIEEIVVGVAVESVAGYSGAVSLSTSGEPVGVTSDLSPSSVDAPGSAAWTLSLDTAVPGGSHFVTLTADDGTDQQIAHFLLDVVDPAQAPTLIEPANGAADVDLQPTFTWEPVSAVDEYRIQVATDSAFDDLVIDAEVAGTSFPVTTELESDTQHFWRVQGTVGCAGTWSDVFSFTTETQPLAEVTPEALGFEVPAGGSDSATVGIANVGTGDLVWSIETAQPPLVAAGGSTRRGAAPHGALPPRGGGSGAGAALDLASVLGKPLPSVRPIGPIGGVVDCDSEPRLILHDDGTVESGYSGNPGVVSQVIFADRFTPSAYPASFRAVCVAFLTQGPTSLDFEIVVFDDDGPDGAPGTELGALPVSANGLPDQGEQPVWFSYDISSLGIEIDSGSLYIGARWAPSNPNVFIASDHSPGNPIGFAGGYWWNDNDGGWQKIQDQGGGFAEYRSLFVRAVENPGGCLDPSSIPWLSVTPESGGTPAGGSTPVEVTVDATGLDAGQYRASLCVSTNDASHSLVVVPVTLVVTEGGVALTFDPSSLDFGEVAVGETSPPQAAMLDNVGDADATGLTFSLPGDGFDADTGACGDALPAGESCLVSVTFTPVAPGPAVATLEVTGDQDTAASLGLTGHGVGEEGFTAMAIEVDPDELGSDGNEVFEPGELVEVAPAWRNDGTTPQGLSGDASDFTGPEGALYTLAHDGADYGTLDPAQTASCLETGVCYQVSVDDPAIRPAPHWEATFDETLDDSDGTSKTWTLHIGDSFVDVPRTNLFYPSVEILLHHGVTGGCTDTEYCPTASTTRDQMPVFVLRAVEGADYEPPACVEGAEVFHDVSAGSVFCPWIEELANRGVVSGCGGHNYCPNAPVTRAQMAIFLLRSLEGSDYEPPACTGQFVDVACPSLFADWIEDLFARKITGGCSNQPLRYCPANPVNREQMAAFIGKAFGLTLYGP